MRYEKRKGYKCIQGTGAEDFEARVNAVLTDYPSADLKIDALVPFVCHAFFFVEKAVPECKAEEYEVKGEVHYCIECPHIDRPKTSNRNQKRFPCPFANYGMTMTDTRCCDKYYEFLEKQEQINGRG